MPYTQLKKHIISFVIILLLMPIQNTFAAGAANISPVFVGCLRGGICYIGASPPVTQSTCEHGGQIRLDISQSGSKEMYAAALSAAAAGKLINVYVTDECIDGYPSPLYLHFVAS